MLIDLALENAWIGVAFSHPDRHVQYTKRHGEIYRRWMDLTCHHDLMNMYLLFLSITHVTKKNPAELYPEYRV